MKRQTHIRIYEEDKRLFKSWIKRLKLRKSSVRGEATAFNLMLRYCIRSKK